MNKVTGIQLQSNIVNAKDVKKPPYPVNKSFGYILNEELLRKGVKLWKQKQK